MREPEDRFGVAFRMAIFRTTLHSSSANNRNPIHYQWISLQTPWTVRLLRQTRSAGKTSPQNHRTAAFWPGVASST